MSHTARSIVPGLLVSSCVLFGIGSVAIVAGVRQYRPNVARVVQLHRWLHRWRLSEQEHGRQGKNACRQLYDVG